MHHHFKNVSNSVHCCLSAACEFICDVERAVYVFSVSSVAAIGILQCNVTEVVRASVPPSSLIIKPLFILRPRYALLGLSAVSYGSMTGYLMG